MPDHEHFVSFEEIKKRVEALLFTAEEPLEAGQIKRYIEPPDVTLSDVRLALSTLANEYQNHAFELHEHNNTYQLRTRDAYFEFIQKPHLLKPRSLSQSALETLAVIAYKQPITKAQISALRQMDSAAIIQSLKEKELIYVSGTRKNAPGHPFEYRTTEKFLNIFGLKNLTELPSLLSLQLDAQEMQNAKTALQSLEAAALLGDEDSLVFSESEPHMSLL